MIAKLKVIFVHYITVMLQFLWYYKGTRKNEKLEYRAIIKYLCLKELRGTQIYKDILDALSEQCPYLKKNWIVIFKRGTFSIEGKEQ